MYLTGYHGTKLKNAEEIMKENKYLPSKSSKEWLGEGIYFYTEFEDAYKWNESEAILHSIIEIDENAFLDFTSDSGKKLLYKIIDYLEKFRSEDFDKTEQENQCTIMNEIWKNYPEINVLIAEFPRRKRRIRILIDPRPKRKEFCVRNNECIKLTQLIRKDELNG